MTVWYVEPTAYGVEVAVPHPPSVSRYYRHRHGARRMSAEGRKYRASVEAIFYGKRYPCLEGRLAVHVLLCPPNRAKRDLDNFNKALLDAMTHVGLWQDDSQIDSLHIERGAVRKPATAIVTVWRANESHR